MGDWTPIELQGKDSAVLNRHFLVVYILRTPFVNIYRLVCMIMKRTKITAAMRSGQKLYALVT